MSIRQEIKTGKYGDYTVYVVPNSEPYDLVNTLQKMAQKRALVAAVLITTNASEFYTQDIEDMNIIEGEWHESEGNKQQSSTQTKQVVNGTISKQSTHKPGRPASPEDVKAGIVKHAKDFAKQGEANLSEAQMNLLRYGLELCFEAQEPKVIDDKRHALLKYLTGIPSTKDILSSQFRAIVEKWLEMKKTPDGSGEYLINQFSAQEAESIVAASLLDEGKLTLNV
jgi:hypothetical protein